MLVSSKDVQLLLKRQMAYDTMAVVAEVPGNDLTETTIVEVESVEPSSAQSIIKSKNIILAANGSDMAFYTSQAGTFIEGIIGNGITLAAEYAAGSFKKGQEESYILDMDMTFKDKHAVKPALFLFKKSQPNGNIETEALSDMSIRCTGMNMDINTIVSLIIGG